MIIDTATIIRARDSLMDAELFEVHCEDKRILVLAVNESDLIACLLNLVVEGDHDDGDIVIFQYGRRRADRAKDKYMHVQCESKDDAVIL